MLSKELPPGQSVNVPIVGVISLQQPGYSLPHPVKFPLCLHGLHSVQDSKAPVCGSPELSFCIALSPLLHCSCLLQHCPLTRGGCQAALGPFPVLGFKKQPPGRKPGSHGGPFLHLPLLVLGCPGPSIPKWLFCIFCPVF